MIGFQRVDQYVHGRQLALYDLQADPGQRVDLIDDEAHRPVAERMKQLMLQQIEGAIASQLENHRLALHGEVPVLLQNPQRYRIAGD